MALLSHDIIKKIAFEYMDGVDALYFSCSNKNIRRAIFGCSGWRLEKWKGLIVVICHASMFGHRGRLSWLKKMQSHKFLRSAKSIEYARDLMECLLPLKIGINMTKTLIHEDERADSLFIFCRKTEYVRVSEIVSFFKGFGCSKKHDVKKIEYEALGNILCSDGDMFTYFDSIKNHIDCRLRSIVLVYEVLRSSAETYGKYINR